MSNHSHTVLKINDHLARAWSDEQVIKRWEQLFSIPVLVKRYFNGECHSEAEQDKARETIDIFRLRLMDISWFMRCINEHIARKANTEDKCTGRFWEGRFKSQALLDEQAILSCMIYVDLNPIRTDICKTLETSKHTSIEQRINQITQTKISNHTCNTTVVKLSPFIGSSLKENGIVFDLKDYLELADWTGRIVKDDKRSFNETNTPSILQKLKLDEQTWLDTVQGFSKGFHSFVGQEEQLKSLCQRQQKYWIRDVNVCRKPFKNSHSIPITT